MKRYTTPCTTASQLVYAMGALCVSIKGPVSGGDESGDQSEAF